MLLAGCGSRTGIEVDRALDVAAGRAGHAALAPIGGHVANGGVSLVSTGSPRGGSSNHGGGVAPHGGKWTNTSVGGSYGTTSLPEGGSFANTSGVSSQAGSANSAAGASVAGSPAAGTAGMTTTATTCGNGLLDPLETCDTAIAEGKPGACPKSCDDGNACTIDETNGAECTLSCRNVAGPCGHRQLSSGAFHTCAVVTDGRVFCWGGNTWGQLGTNSSVSSAIPLEVAGVIAVEVAAGGGVACTPLPTDPNAPPDPRDVPAAPWKHCEEYGLLGTAHSCARTRAGSVHCWGSNADLQLGIDTQHPFAWTVPEIRYLAAAQVVAGESHTCVRTNDRVGSSTISCWGYDGVKYYSSALQEADGAPITVFANLGVVDVTAGGGHNCTRDDSGRVFCWGNNCYQQLGYSDRTNRTSPSPVSGVAALEVVAGGGHTCLRDSDAVVFCWGDNTWGQFHDSSAYTSSATRNRVVGMTNAVEIAAGDRHTCARRSDGTVLCWGANNSGQLGDGTKVDHWMAQPVLGLTGAVEIAAGSEHSCARLTSGKVVCWGENAVGQLGDGTLIDSPTPVTVLLP